MHFRKLYIQFYICTFFTLYKKYKIYICIQIYNKEYLFFLIYFCKNMAKMDKIIHVIVLHYYACLSMQILCKNYLLIIIF